MFRIFDLLTKLKNVKNIDDILIFRALTEIIQSKTTLLDRYKGKDI